MIHLANLAGMDKLSHGERATFVVANADVFFDNADQPLSGQRQWMKVDDPWQYLAACIEFANALRYHDGPEAYPCSLPIQQDGTCNGLQHYSALGGDPLGAYSVNVLPSDRPQDVYSDVSAIVEKRISKERLDGHPLALMLEGKIQRDRKSVV